MLMEEVPSSSPIKQLAGAFNIVTVDTVSNMNINALDALADALVRSARPKSIPIKKQQQTRDEQLTALQRAHAHECRNDSTWMVDEGSTILTTIGLFIANCVNTEVATHLVDIHNRQLLRKE